MHFLISPAKTLDYESPLAIESETLPRYLSQSTELIELLKPKTTPEIAELMDLSENLAELNVKRYRAWSRRFTAKNSRPAVLAFNGDVYEGLSASSLQPKDLAWAQQHVSILSGLYGLLRPLDRMQPYRLEMGTALVNAHGKNLYAFWGDLLAQELNAIAAADASPVIVNLASQEYFRAVDRRVLSPRVIECVFEDWKNGQYKVISFFAKKARGLMLRYAITQRLKTPKALEKFNLEGYRFSALDSQPDRLVFHRRIGEA